MLDPATALQDMQTDDVKRYHCVVATRDALDDARYVSSSEDVRMH